MPTLLIDEFETGGRAGDRDRLRLLRSGSTRDGHVIRGGNVYNAFCTEVVFSRAGTLRCRGGKPRNLHSYAAYKRGVLLGAGTPPFSRSPIGFNRSYCTIA